MEKIQLNVKVEFKSVFLLRLYLYCKSLTGIFINLIGVAAIVFYFILPRNIPFASLPSYTELILGIGLISYCPIELFFSTKKSSKKEARFLEFITYEFTPDLLSIAGTNFASTTRLAVLTRIIETTSWFLIFPNPSAAYFIPKNSITAEQLNCMRIWFNNLKNVKVKLK